MVRAQERSLLLVFTLGDGTVWAGWLVVVKVLLDGGRLSSGGEQGTGFGD